MSLLVSTLPLRAQTTPSALPELAPAYGELPATFWEQHHWAIILSGVAFLFVVAVILLLILLLRLKPPVILSPEAVARQALAKLQGRPEDGKLLSEVSQILRKYIAVTHGLPFAEMTTAEFSVALAASQKIDRELARTVSGFLREFDSRKFSQSFPLPPANAVARALDLILRAEKHLASTRRAGTSIQANSAK